MKVYSIVFIVLLLAQACKPVSSSTSEELDHIQVINSLDVFNQQNDFSLLGEIVDEASLVCLGESRHDIHEQFVLKHGFIKYLVEEKGFTAFALEASFPYANKINDYVLDGKGNLDSLLAEMPGWFLWDTKEMRDILLWFNKYNKNVDEKQKVQFFGIDIVAPNDGLKQIFSYLQKVDVGFYIECSSLDFAQDLLNDQYWPITRSTYANLSNDRKVILGQNYKILYDYFQEQKENFISQTSLTEYNWISQLVYSVMEANHMFSAVESMNQGLIREHAMAENTLWIIQKCIPNQKLILWAHNVHIAKGVFTMSLEEGSIKGMGYELYEILGEKMVSIGASFNELEFVEEGLVMEPADESSIDGRLAQLGYDLMIFDMTELTDKNLEKYGLNYENSMRGHNFDMQCNPYKSFDAFYFTNKVTKVTYSETTQQKSQRN